MYSKCRSSTVVSRKLNPCEMPYALVPRLLTSEAMAWNFDVLLRFLSENKLSILIFPQGPIRKDGSWHPSPCLWPTVSGAAWLWVTDRNPNTHVTSQRAVEHGCSASARWRVRWCKYLHLPGSREFVCSNAQRETGFHDG